ncbi:MAG: hypothetical protein H0S82_02145, partial [Anaerolineaceae bacterium]|nr:hypothetical protein [Anaerolineaceae bacterium]
AGANSHYHNNPEETGAVENHAHPITGSVGNATGSTGFYATANDQSAPVGHDHPNQTGTSGSGGGHAHPLNSTKTAAVFPPYHRLYWIRALKVTAFPIGGILMWDDVIANLPGGFHVCDGQDHNSLTTPDLREEFIYGAAKDADVGLTGGSETHVHENEDVEAAGGHAHGMSVNVGGAPSSNNASGYEGTTVAAGGHGHNLTATSNADEDHIHELGDTDPASSLPPFLMLFFAMRTE